MPDQPISPELMKMMPQGGGAADGNMPPAGTPSTTPQSNEGEKMQAQSKVQMAMHLLAQTITAFGPGSAEGKCVLTSLKTLGHTFGDQHEKGRELIPSEILNMMSSMPGKSGGSMTTPPQGGQPAAQPMAA